MGVSRVWIAVLDQTIIFAVQKEEEGSMMSTSEGFLCLRFILLGWHALLHASTLFLHSIKSAILDAVFKTVSVSTRYF